MEWEKMITQLEEEQEKSIKLLAELERRRDAEAQRLIELETSITLTTKLIKRTNKLIKGAKKCQQV